MPSPRGACAAPVRGDPVAAQDSALWSTARTERRRARAGAHARCALHGVGGIGNGVGE